MPFPITSSEDYILLECNKYLSILNKIIFDDLTELLRELLHHSIANSKIEDYYNAVKNKLKKRFTQREEELICNASRTGYRPFDITTIAVLLRHIHEKNNVEILITTLMRIRNELCHLTNTNITESQFEIYFDQCCNIANALEEYLKKPKFLEQKFQIIYEVNTRSKEDRIDLQIETVKHSLTEFKFPAKNRLEPPEQTKWFLNARGNKPCTNSKSLKYVVEEHTDKTRRDPVLDKTEVARKTDEKECCERLKTFKHPLPFRSKLHLEQSEVCNDQGIRKCPSEIGTFDHSALFATTKTGFCNRRSLDKPDQLVVHLRSGNEKCKLDQACSSCVGTGNKSVSRSRSPLVDTVKKLSVDEIGACQSQTQSQSSTINKDQEHLIQNSIKDHIQDSLAIPHTPEGQDNPKYMFKTHKVDLQKPASEQKKTFRQKQRKRYSKTERHAEYSLPSKESFSSWNIAVAVPKNSKKQYLHRRYSKRKSCEVIKEVTLMARRLSGLPSKEGTLFDFVCSLLRNRKRKKRTKIKDSLSELGVDWRLDVKELNKELTDDKSDHEICYGTAVVLHSEFPEDSHKAGSFLKKFNNTIPEVKIELQDEVSKPGEMLLDVNPYFTRHYIFVLLSQYYHESKIFQYIANTCLVMSLEDENKRGRVIPVLMTKDDKLPTEFRAIKPVKYDDENFRKKMLPFFKPGLIRSFSC
ncbi:uncharacterized protein [Mytilus edulis]|uniref:uncharacterized protein n=1 Tax=Mytilus edulis TaxID=6550 RepID=UPI0039EE8CE7